MYYFLGYQIGRENNGLWATLSKTSTHNPTAKEEQGMGNAPQDKAPIVTNDHPDEDRSAPLSPLGIRYCQIIIGCLNWAGTFGRIDMAYAA